MLQCLLLFNICQDMICDKKYIHGVCENTNSQKLNGRFKNYKENIFKH